MDKQDDFAKQQVQIDIYESDIPTDGAINQDIQIKLKAQAINGCYSDLEIGITKIDERHFVFKATGLFETNGICPDVMVYKDTTITFRPRSIGKYFFQTNELPFKIKQDTIEIN